MKNKCVMAFALFLISFATSAQVGTTNLPNPENDGPMGATGDPLSAIVGFPLESLTFAPIASPDLLVPNLLNLIGAGSSVNPVVLAEIGSGLGFQLLETLAPSVEILQDNPMEFPDYILHDGGLLTSNSALALVPPVPILNSPLLGH